MKISKQTKTDLLSLVDHVRRDISYNAGGTYALNSGEDEEVNTKAVRQSERAINFINQLISLN